MCKWDLIKPKGICTAKETVTTQKDNLQNGIKDLQSKLPEEINVQDIQVAHAADSHKKKTH